MVRSDVRDLTLEERLKLKKNGFAENPRQRDDSSDDDDQDHDTGDEEDEGQPSKKRANKNRPREMTSKRPVGRFREVLQVRKKATRDPRFDNASGKLNEDLFKKSYAFLEEYKEAELNDVKKQLKKAKSATRKAELQNCRSENKNSPKPSGLIREAVESGKGAFYLKRKDKKQLELKAKYDELAESGRLSKFMAKRRKKNANKDHRWLPTQRKT
ncbi:hypothetical protein Ae201684P_016551 [Aphanomyces euteiches]|nr:hypothetical protein Ae201684P_016551 [Aphanomyces euteiches]